MDLATLASELADEVFESIAGRQSARGSTYRLQCNAAFKFQDGERIVPYLRSLGITHVYASPYLKALPGSMHGYDVCDPHQLNPDLGTAEEHARFIARLKDHGLGHVLDVVPNHMAASSLNAWWMDVLENGPSSQYAEYFDVDWLPVKGELAGRVLLPILGEQYGAVLESGQLKLDHAEGAFFLRYFDNVLPIGPKTTLPILSHRIDELKQALGESSEPFLEYQSIITALEHLPSDISTAPEARVKRQREKEVVKRRLKRLQSEHPEVEEHLRRNIEEFNGKPGEPSSFDRLDQLVSAQSYRLSHWKAAADEVNYRRFFDVNGLAAVCMENAQVFEDTHRLVLELVARGDVDGLRIDHIDGLFDPTRYLWRLQWAFLSELGRHLYEEKAAALRSWLEEHPQTEAAPASAQALATDRESRIAAEAGGESRLSGGSSAAVAELPASTEPAPPQIPEWRDVRPAMLRMLCERLQLPPPDNEFLGLSEGPTDHEAAVYQMRPHAGHELPLYVVVEKILGPDEPIPDNWATAGTTGYEYLHLLNGLFIDPQGLQQIFQSYSRFTGEKINFAEAVYRCKMLILRFSMASELQMLAHRLNRISEQHRRSRDFTLNTLRHALREILACFPVYRTYAGPAIVSDRDRRFVNQAIAHAKRRNPAIDAAVFDFIREILLLEHPEGLNERARLDREVFTGRFQQVTSPVMAKGLEDTAFYTYCPLLSANEVGGRPDAAVTSPENFHQDNMERQSQRPLSMICTSTHDTKRSEDVRARINVLTEMPHRWRKASNQWARLNRRYHRDVDGEPAPSRNDEYMFYQTLVGVWPLVRPTPAEHAELIHRLQAYMEKATREAKIRTSWVNPNTAYDEAVREFVAGVLQPRQGNRFLAEFQAFHEEVLDYGLYTALSQTVLKLLSPGVPDIYQGQEVWDFSLVDPDNRRPVDYALRQRWLGELQAATAAGSTSQLDLARNLARTPRDPRIKQLVTWKLLEQRRECAAMFAKGNYVPLQAKGAFANHVCALAWRVDAPSNGCRTIVAVVPRLIAQLAAAAERGADPRCILDPSIWGQTRVELSFQSPSIWRNLFTGAEIGGEPSLPVGQLLADFPVAVLIAAE